MAAPIEVCVLEDDKEVSNRLCELVLSSAKTALNDRKVFKIGVSGGSAAKFLCNGLPNKETDFSKWQIFFCDERHVPFSDPECTYSFYKENLMTKVNISESQIFPLDPNLSVEEAANDYSEKLRRVFGDRVPRFDCLVLGMGPDGHTCSLFPGHPLLKETSKIAAAIKDSPKPPPQRVTLTFPVINNCALALFASCGAGKADIVQKVLQDARASPQPDDALPAARVKPTNGKVVWLLDKPAASKVKQ